jgi:cell division protease FtsH
MDTAFTRNLDEHIRRSQQISKQLDGSLQADGLQRRRNRADIAVKSARSFLAYCALTRLFRQNIGAMSEPSCVALITVPYNWQVRDINEAAKTIFKFDDKIRLCVHPSKKNRREWDIDPTEYIDAGRLIVFIQVGSPIHEDFELAATVRAQLDLCHPRHLQALGRLRGCGFVSQGHEALIREQPAERLEAIFRLGQPAERAAERLSKEIGKRAIVSEPKLLDVSKGFGEASIWAEELKQDLQDWRDGRLSWSDVDKGCLLYGPPGTGKTRFAAALAAECGLHLEAASISKWQSMKDGHLGDMLKAMYGAFSAAKEAAPCLLFIDEFDSIGDRTKFPARHAGYSTQVVNALLESLDGVGNREGVVVVGACNFPERIDAALLRSGRLEKHVHFPMPDASARADILSFHLPTLAGDAELEAIAARLPGSSGADLERLARGAQRLARKEKRPVCIADVKAKITPRSQLDATALHRIAVHEAGHAIAAHALSLGKIQLVEIYDNVSRFATTTNANGITRIEFPPNEFVTRWDMMKTITMLLAGAAAEDLVLGFRSRWSAGSQESDFAKATTLAVQMITEYGFGRSLFYLPGSVDISRPSQLWRDVGLRDEVDDILHEQYDRARDMLDGLRTCLVDLAEDLVRNKSLNAEQLEKHWPGARSASAHSPRH